MKSVLLQPWTSIASGLSNTAFTQDSDQWVDLADYSDIAGIWIDTSAVDGTNVQLVVQSSPSYDESYFQPVTPPVNLVASSTPTFVKAVRTAYTSPLARWARWQLTGTPGVVSGLWGATFRIRAAVAKQQVFVPTDLPGCVQWLRADLGITPGPGATISHVQFGKNISAGAVTTLTVTLANPVAVGDLLVLGVRAGTGNPPTISDGTPNVWVQNEANTSDAYIFSVINTTAQTSLTITITAALAVIRAICDVFSGVNAFFLGSATTTPATTALACAATGPCHSGSLVWAFFATSVNSEAYTAGASNGASCVAGETISDPANGSAFTEWVLTAIAGQQAPTATASVAGAQSALCAVFPAVAFPAVAGWSDQSPLGGPNGDPNKNLTQVTGVNQPTFIPADSNFNQNPSSGGVTPFLPPTIKFASANNTNLVSGTWLALQSQPTTWVVVAYNTSTGPSYPIQEVFSTPNMTFQEVLRSGGTTPSIDIATASGGLIASTTITWANPAAVLAEFNDPNSKIYFNNFTTAIASGSAGTGGTQSLLVGGQAAQFWDGYVAEIIAYNRILSASEKARLRTYLNARYQRGIT